MSETDTANELPLLDLHLRSDLNILVGRWGYQPEPSALPAAYADLTAEALACGCRLWLQDIRRRSLNDPATTKWLLDEYFPDMGQRLDGRLYVAYLVGPALHQHILNDPGYRPVETYDGQPFVIEFFGDEGAATHWAAKPGNGRLIHDKKQCCLTR